jgi:hypothetical protein
MQRRGGASRLPFVSCMSGRPTAPSGILHAWDVVTRQPFFVNLSCDFIAGDPDWIRIQWLFGSGSVLGIRIRIQGKKTKKFQWKKALFSYLKKNLPLKRYKIALTTFWKKFRWRTPIFFIWFDSNFDFKQILERNCLRKFCFSLDPDPDWAKILDPDPY